MPKSKLTWKDSTDAGFKKNCSEDEDFYINNNKNPITLDNVHFFADSLFLKFGHFSIGLNVKSSSYKV